MFFPNGGEEFRLFFATFDQGSLTSVEGHTFIDMGCQRALFYLKIAMREIF